MSAALENRLSVAAGQRLFLVWSWQRLQISGGGFEEMGVENSSYIQLHIPATLFFMLHCLLGKTRRIKEEQQLETPGDR